MKTIPLSDGKAFAIVDDVDHPSLAIYKWQITVSGYAIRNQSRKIKNRKMIWMHRVIAGDPSGFQIDHIDGNKLNNVRSNLRKCLQCQNSRNQNKNSANTSGFKGVYFCRCTRKWRARIKVDQKNIHLGRFDTAQLAGWAYDAAALVYHGEFSKTNHSLGLLP